MKFPGFVGPAYTLQNTTMEAQRCVNIYPQMDESGVGKNVANLLRTPGLKAYGVIPGTIPLTLRGLFVTAQGRVFVVANSGFYEISEPTGTPVFTSRGTLSTSSGRVSMAENGQEIMIVDGPNGYSFDLSTNIFLSIGGFPGGTTVAFLDGFFLFNQPDTQVFWITQPYSTTIDPLDFASAEGSPDNLVSLLSDHRELWLFGTQTIEVWFNSGDPAFPFARIPGAYITHGTPAPFSPAALDNTIYWLGQDATGQGMVWRAAGYQPVRCSTHAIEAAMRTYPTIADATSYTYQLDGHAFYVLNFPSGDATWVFDAATNLWHERAFSNADGTLSRHRAEIHVTAFGGKHLVTDYVLNKLYTLDANTYDDGLSFISGLTKTAISCIRTTPYISNELKNMFISRVQLDMQMGQGNVSVGIPPTVRQPQCMLSWSDDGGYTYSNEHFIDMGDVGEYKKRAIWRRLGRSRERVFLFKITDPIPFVITDCFIDVGQGTS